MINIYMTTAFLLVIIGACLISERREVRIIGLGGNAIRTKAAYCVIAAVIVISIIGLRSHTIGSDTNGYYRAYYYDRLTFSSFFSNYVGYLKAGIMNFFSDKNDTVFHFVCSIFNRLGMSFNTCLTILAIIYVAPVFYLIHKDSSNVWLSSFWYFVLSLSLGLSGVRITIAIGLTTISYILFNKGKKVRSIILFILAVMMHLSAFVFILFFFVDKIKVEKKSLYYLIPVFLISPIAGNYISPMLLRLTYYQDMNMSNITWNYQIYVFFAITTILLIWYSPEEYEQYKKMMIIGTIICGFINYGALANTYRYYTQYLCIILPGLANKLDNKNTRLIFQIVYFIVGIYLLSRTFSAGSSFVPYKFFWQ